jgi:hypothetical protein
MKRMRMMGLCLIAVFAVSATSASAKSLTLSTAGKGVLTKGTTVTNFSSNLVFTTVAGNLECEEVTLSGPLGTNGEAKDKGEVTSSISQGNYLEIPGACKTSATGPVFVESSKLPWTSTFSLKGGEVAGKKITFTTTFLALEPPNNKCTFEASKSKFTYATPITTTPASNTLITTAQKFKHAKKAPNQSALCPAEGTLGGEFAPTAGGEPVLFAQT